MKRQRGFTLMEVMIGLAMLGVALVILIKSAGSNIFNARQAQMMGIATDLSRSKMYDIEERLLKDGFSETDQSEGSIGEEDTTTKVDPNTGELIITRETKGRDGKCFEEEGWPNICYAYKVEQVELPNFEELQAMAQGRATGSGSGSAGSGSGEEPGGFENSALGGMLSMMGGGLGGGGGGSGGNIDDAMGGAFLQGQYTMVQQVLKASIRKVTLVVWWDISGHERDLKTVAFFTDAAAMDKVLMGLGSQDLPENSGTTPSSGSGSGTTRPTTPGGTNGGTKK